MKLLRAPALQEGAPFTAVGGHTLYAMASVKIRPYEKQQLVRVRLGVCILELKWPKGWGD